jgi:hypothetical protein
MQIRNVTITIEQAKEWIKNDQLRDIALEAFPELKEKPLPKTWEELDEINGFFIDNSSHIDSPGECSTCEDNKNLFATREQAEASIALAQLSQLLKVYRNNWVPNWKDNYYKYCIFFEEDLVSTTTLISSNKFLSFQDRETRDLFLENFIDLIKQAKPLIS